MKKLMTAYLAACLLFMSVSAVYAEWGILAEEDCVISADGELTAYTGEFYDAVSVPFDMGGRHIIKLADGLFAGESVETVYIEEGIEEIGSRCFAASDIDYIDIPATVKVIGEEAFKGCGGLRSLSLASADVEIGRNAFAQTGFLYIAVPCTADLLSLHDIISEAKGDDEFTFDLMHSSLEESMFRKDMFGDPLMECKDCGFVGSINMTLAGLPFEDVSPDAWYYGYVSAAYEMGILNGKSDNAFDPDANMTLAEAAKIAACIDMFDSGTEEEMIAQAGEKWYMPYVRYCYDKNIIDSHVSFDWDKYATRAEMAYMFSRTESDGFVLNPDVPMTDIPDVDEKTPFAENILDLYRRGIATGSNEYYAFYPESNVKRSEAAALISRIVYVDMRIELPKG